MTADEQLDALVLAGRLGSWEVSAVHRQGHGGVVIDWRAAARVVVGEPLDDFAGRTVMTSEAWAETRPLVVERLLDVMLRAGIGRTRRRIVPGWHPAAETETTAP